MKKHITIAGLCFVAISGIPASAQIKNIAELETKYAGENAVILNNREDLVLDFEKGELKARSFTNQKILLLNEIATNIYNTENVYHSYFHQLKTLKAYSWIPNNKGVYKSIAAEVLKSTNVKSDNIFFDDNKVSVVGFTGLVKNAYTETHYEEEHINLGFLTPFYFSTHLPSVENTYTISVPKEVELKTILLDTADVPISYSVKEQKNKLIHTWSTQYTRRYKQYANAPSGIEGLARIIPYVASYTDPKTKEKVQLINDSKSLYRFLYQYVKDINQKEDPQIKNIVEGLTKDCQNDWCKAEKIYRWVQKNIKYVAFEDSLGGFIPREAATICQRKFGDCKDMSSLLVSMLKTAGIDAHYTWIGTRSLPYKISEVPLPIIFNHMICGWKHEGKWVFIDGTHPTIQFGIPPSALQGKDALISIDKDRYEIAQVPEMPETENQTQDTSWIHIEKNKALAGKTHISYTGYQAWSMKSVLLYSSEKETEETVKNIGSRGSNKYEQKTGKAEVRENEVSLYTTFEIKDYIQEYNDELYVNMNLLRYNTDQRVEDADIRKVPIENPYNSIVQHVVYLDIPKGYTVSYLPRNEKQDVPGLWGYSIEYSVENNRVLCHKTYTDHSLYIEPQQFSRHNKMVEALNKLYKETVVLKAQKQ